MDIISAILIILGLALFEIVSSIDNAVINAEILGSMSDKGKKWFLLWGFLFAVVVVRGLLPWVIIWATNPSLGFIGSLTATLSSSPAIAESIAQSSPVLFAGGGIFLLFLFLHWLFLEKKEYGLTAEKFFSKHGVWFFAIASLILTGLVYFAFKISTDVAFALVVGSSAFFLMHGFKENAEKAETEMLSGASNKTDLSKILYLEIIDTSFSIDGVLGAFAFTLSVPYILIGNGIGAYILRRLTVKNVDTIKKYKFLKNGAMYAIAALGVIMLADAFGHSTPEWLSPVVMIVVIGLFFWKSKNTIAAAQKIVPATSS